MIRHILPQGLGTALLACYGDFRAHQLMLCFVLAGELQATQGAFDFSTAADGFQMARHELTLYCFATNLTLDHRLGADFGLMALQILSDHDFLASRAFDDGLLTDLNMLVRVTIGPEDCIAAENRASHLLLEAGVGMLTEFDILHHATTLTLDLDLVEHFLKAAAERLEPFLIPASRAVLALLIVPILSAEGAKESVATGASALLCIVDKFAADATIYILNFDRLFDERRGTVKEIAVVDRPSDHFPDLVHEPLFLKGKIFFRRLKGLCFLSLDRRVILILHLLEFFLCIVARATLVDNVTVRFI